MRKVRMVRAVLKVVVMMVLALPAVARAQDAPKGYLQGIVGAAHTEETDSAYAGLGAWRVSGRLHIFGEVGRMRNVIGPELSRELAEVEAQIIASNMTQFNTTFPVVFDARVPTWYGLGGVRADGPSRGKLTTYVEGGVGTARLDPQVHLTINGENLDNEAAALTGLDDDPQKLEFIAGGGAGVAFQVWKRIRVEGGYRYMRLFGSDKTNINRVHVGAGWTF
ncbi:MAG TPA: outer membrane beta-barrel protein [Vicinamibacterales bacterium]|nr:outer membrane beta-barrel protein [Vicinamibacterales bacterium]